MKNNWKIKGKYLLVLAISASITYFLFRFGFSLFVPFVFSYWLAKLLLPLSTFLNKKMHFTKTISCAGVTLLSVLLICAIAGWLGYSLINQAIGFLSGFPAIMEQLRGKMNRICDCCDTYFKLSNGTTRQFAATSLNRVQTTVKDSYLPKITAGSVVFGKKIFNFCLAFFMMFFSTYYLLKDWDRLYKTYENSMFFREIRLLKEKLMHTGAAWLKTQFIIFLIVAIIISGGLLLTKNPYSLLLGVIIAILDALPFIGSGLFLVPWAILDLIGNNYKNAAILVALFIICQLVRETLEPRLMGDHMGIPPLYSIVSVFLGIKLFGIWGVILGPLGLILIQTIMREYKLTI